nr:immunoglobulin heavy chain junction region [Macaca mulatta]MOY29678.1 immunoglobulin heavy chain junction region [Macaca mulatta]
CGKVANGSFLYW